MPSLSLEQSFVLWQSSAGRWRGSFGEDWRLARGCMPDVCVSSITTFLLDGSVWRSLTEAHNSTSTGNPWAIDRNCMWLHSKHPLAHPEAWNKAAHGAALQPFVGWLQAFGWLRLRVPWHHLGALAMASNKSHHCCCKPVWPVWHLIETHFRGVIGYIYIYICIRILQYAINNKVRGSSWNNPWSILGLNMLEPPWRSRCALDSERIRPQAASSGWHPAQCLCHRAGGSMCSTCAPMTVDVGLCNSQWSGQSFSCVFPFPMFFHLRGQSQCRLAYAVCSHKQWTGTFALDALA